MNGNSEQFEAIVVGGGQAGLATGYYLARAGLRFRILDAGERVGESWRKRWDSLKLFTPAQYNTLPGMPFPSPPGRQPSKDEMAGYLEAYAEQFELPVQLKTRVDSLTREGEKYLLTAGSRQFIADHVVVATGHYQTPSTPAFAVELDPAIEQQHASQYTNPDRLQPGSVLVVGVGQSGAEIAKELAAVRQSWLAGKPHYQLPDTFLGRHFFWWAWPILSRIRRDTWLGRGVAARMKRVGDPVIGISTADLAQRGVRLVSRITGVKEGKPVTEDGQILDVSNVIWATGFRQEDHWISLNIFEDDGRPWHTRGVVEGEPGLYFVGRRFQHRLISHLVGGVGADARYVVSVIAERQSSS